MRELRIHGRGGQGAVIASKVLASALFLEGKSVQSFPAFGVERRGAPVTAFLRLADGPILLRCEITEPDDLIVLDPDADQGHRRDARASSPAAPSSSTPTGRPRPTPRWRSASASRVVDASAIARRHGLGSKTQPIVNTAILGAFAAVLGLVRSSRCARRSSRRSPQRARGNVAAATRGRGRA